MYGSVVQCAARGFAGGGGAKKKPMPKDATDFDLVLVGGANCAALLKFLQKNDDAQNLRMAIVSPQAVWVQPQCYFGVTHRFISTLKLQTGALAGQCDAWSKIEGMTSVTELKPDNNSMTLSNGKEFTYKALVLAPGFSHESSYIEGLGEFETGPETNNVWVHSFNDRANAERNFFNGYQSLAGDNIMYSPKFPYKGEGSDFYALYYEHMMRQDKLMGLASENARIQYWTPNKEIYKFPYANAIALDECEKRGIDVHFGWEMMSVKYNDAGEKVATFKNVDSGEVIEKEFNAASINPPSKPHDFIRNSGLADANGLIDVNRYTLQHNKYENVFAFGDAIAGETTRTYVGAQWQNPIVKHNVLQFLHGRECNAVYNGYTYMPFYNGTRYGTYFSHLHDFEPSPKNHMIPAYGVFGRIGIGLGMKHAAWTADAYSGMKKTHGPPHKMGWWPAIYDPLEHNQYLNSKGIPAEEARHPAAQQRYLESNPSPAIGE